MARHVKIQTETLETDDPWLNNAIPPGGLRLTACIGEGVGYVAAALLVVLTISIIVGIAMRAVGLDNSWTYDVDLFALIWVAFIGAAFTSMRESHVTSGVALENMYPRCAFLMLVLRFLIVAGFLIVFTVSGYTQFIDSVRMHETTLDIMSWPVWIATVALPIGTLLWLIAEIHHFLRRWSAKRG